MTNVDREFLKQVISIIAVKCDHVEHLNTANNTKHDHRSLQWSLIMMMMINIFI